MPKRSSVLPSSDELLARLVRSGGERPFRALYERYHAQLYRYCYSLVRNESDAQDALQSTFTRALIALREGRRSAPVRPWLYRIAHNESISILRARRPVVPQSDPEPSAAGVSAEESASQRARLALLLSDLTQLAERPRAALVMRELGGLSHEEIASALDVSVGAAKQAIFEGRSALFELEEGRAMACDEVRHKLSDRDGRVLRGRQVRAHLRDCGPCAAFAAAIPGRQAELRALVPALPPAAAAAVLAHALQGATSGGHAVAGASAASSGSALAGTGSAASAGSTAASAAKVLAAIATPKALLATAVIAGAAAAGGLVTAAPSHHRVTPPGVTTPLRLGPSVGTKRSTSASSPSARAHANAQSNSAASARRATSSRVSNPGRAANPAHGGNPPAHSSSHGPPPWAPGASNYSASSPGNSSSAPGHSNSSPGKSSSARSRSSSSPGKSSTAKSRLGQAPGLTRHHHPALGQLKQH